MLKKDLRTNYLLQRKSIDKKQYWFLMDALTSQLSKFNWLEFTTISIFLPIVTQNEPDTFDFIYFFKKQHPQLKISVPKTNFSDYSLSHILFTEESILAKNIYQIPEPIYGKKVEIEEIDLVFVPLIIFDEIGYRVGYGKGFYDRFLSKCKAETKKIGISFFEPIPKIIDTDIYDIKLDYCITPNKIYTF